MAYGTLKANTITYDPGSGDTTFNFAQAIQNGFTQISGASGVFTSQVSGATVTGNTGNFTNVAGIGGNFTTLTGTTVTGTTANFVSGVFTTQISGATVRGNLSLFNSGNFASGVVTSGVIQSTSGGFKFPDGTTQTSAATAGVSLGLVIALAG